MDKERIDARVKELVEAKIAYYTTATPIMSDVEFDAKLRELKEWDPDNSALTIIGTPVVSGQKVDLKYQMFSTEKTLAIADMDKYWRRINAVASDTDEIVESQKIDGLSLNLTYIQGSLVRATTSGDGLVGSDKTEKAKFITAIPKTLNRPWSGQISGEAFLTDEHFMDLNVILTAEGSQLQKTSRNSVSGLLNSENLVNAEKKLALISFKAWGLYEDTPETDLYGSFSTYSSQLEAAKTLGVDAVEYRITSKKSFNGEAAINWINDFPYACDGVVYRLNSNEKARQLGLAADYLNAATALKPLAEAAVTTVTKVTWQMGSQELSPVVWYEPVTLGGAVCEKTAGHSVKNLIACNAYPDNKIVIARSGGVIPRMYNVSYAENFGIA